MEENITEDLERKATEDLKRKLKELTGIVEDLHRQIIHQQDLLDECYAIIHYKGAWLSLSDENIKEFRKYRNAKKGKTDADRLWGV